MSCGWQRRCHSVLSLRCSVSMYIPKRTAAVRKGDVLGDAAEHVTGFSRAGEETFLPELMQLGYWLFTAHTGRLSRCPASASLSNKCRRSFKQLKYLALLSRRGACLIPPVYSGELQLAPSSCRSLWISRAAADGETQVLCQGIYLLPCTLSSPAGF